MPSIPRPILFALVSIGYVQGLSNESHCASMLLFDVFSPSEGIIAAPVAADTVRIRAMRVFMVEDFALSLV